MFNFKAVSFVFAPLCSWKEPWTETKQTKKPNYCLGEELVKLSQEQIVDCRKYAEIYQNGEKKCNQEELIKINWIFFKK